MARKSRGHKTNACGEEPAEDSQAGDGQISSPGPSSGGQGRALFALGRAGEMPVHDNPWKSSASMISMPLEEWAAFAVARQAVGWVGSQKKGQERG